MRRSEAGVLLHSAPGRWLLLVVSVQAGIGIVLVLPVVTGIGSWFPEELPVLVLLVLVVVLAFVIVDAVGRVLREQERRRAASDTAAAEDTVARIRSVLADEALLTTFQPIRELTGGKVVCAEALTRFISEEDGSPEPWFRDAASVGLLRELDLAALERALDTAKRLPRNVDVSFNLCPDTCLEPRILGMFKRSGLGMQRIIIEITERTVVEDYGRLLDALAPLRQAGIRIAVDDMGAGFASMRHVLILRPELIKIDRGIISGINADTWQQAFGAAMVAFARETGSAVIAEGIETSEELAAVAALGMFAGQGYLLGSPCTDTDEWATWTAEKDDSAPSEAFGAGASLPSDHP